MKDFLARIFGMQDATADRLEAAGERIAAAAEEMASAWEAARDAMVQRIGVPGSLGKPGRDDRRTALPEPKTTRSGRKAG